MVEEKKKNSYRGLLLVALISCCVHLLYLSGSTHDPTFYRPLIDAQTYDNTAKMLAGGIEPSQEPFFQPPLFPYLLASIYHIFGYRIMMAKVILSLFGVLTAVLTCAVGRRLFGGAVGLIAGVLAAFYGPLVFFNIQLLPAGIATMLGTATLFMLLVAVDTRLPAAWLGVGVLIGLSAITVPNFLLILLVATGWLFVDAWRKKEAAKTVARFVFMLFGVCLIVLPVTARNWIVSRQVVFISTNGGINLYLGNNENTETTLAIRPGLDWDYVERMPIREGVQSASEADRFFQRKVFHYAASHPGLFVRDYLHKLAQLINARELPRTFDIYSYRQFSSVLSVLTWSVGPFFFPWGIVFPLAVIGFLSCCRREPRVWLVFAFLLVLGLSVALFFVTARHRLILVPAVIVLAAQGIWWIFREATARMRMIALGGLVLLVALVNWPVKAATDEFNFNAERHVLLGIRAYDNGNFAQAENEYQHALLIDPTYVDAYNQWGLLDLRMRRSADAVTAFRNAIRLNPAFAEGYNNLGLIYLQTDRLQKAEQQFNRAIGLRPELSKPYGNLGVLYLREGKTAKALQFLRRAIELDPLYYEAGNYLAWVLATHPSAEFRDGDEAVRIAERMIEITGRRDAMFLDTLAAAYAEAGRFEEASLAAEKAVQSAIMEGNEVFADKAGRRALEYRQGKPYRDPALAPEKEEK